MNSPKKTWFAFPYILWIIGFTLIPLMTPGRDSGKMIFRRMVK